MNRGVSKGPLGHAALNIIGQTFGKLKVLARAPNDIRGHARWICSCDCGGTIMTNGSSLRNGSTKSCGCLVHTQKYGVPCRIDGKRTHEYNKRSRQARREKLLPYFRGYYQRNKEKCRQYSKAYRERLRKSDPEKLKALYLRHRLQRKLHNPAGLYRSMKRFHLRRGYGLTLEQYTDMLRLQKYKCYICGRKHLEESRKRLNVDHDHLTGKVRKLLCGSCNSVLGRAGDNINILKRAILYLEEHSVSTNINRTQPN